MVSRAYKYRLKRRVEILKVTVRVYITDLNLKSVGGILIKHGTFQSHVCFMCGKRLIVKLERNILRRY